VEYAILDNRDREQHRDAEPRERHGLPRQHPRGDRELQVTDRCGVGLQLRCQQNAAHCPDRDEKEAAAGAEHQLGFELQVTEHPIQGALHTFAQTRTFDLAADQQDQYCRSGQKFEIRAQHVF